MTLTPWDLGTFTGCPDDTFLDSDGWLLLGRLAEVLAPR